MLRQNVRRNLNNNNNVLVFLYLALSTMSGYRHHYNITGAITF